MKRFKLFSVLALAAVMTVPVGFSSAQPNEGPADADKIPPVEQPFERAAQPLADWYAVLWQRRQIRIQHLHDYWQRAQYPQNTYLADRRTPVFVDANGTPCAMAYLMLQDGQHEMVEQVRQTNNLVRIMDIHDGPVFEWILASGLTQEEAARIQPSYDWPELQPIPEPQPEPLPQPDPELAELIRKLQDARVVEKLRITAHLAATQAFLKENTIAALTTAMQRFRMAYQGPIAEHTFSIEKLAAPDSPVSQQITNETGAAMNVWLRPLAADGKPLGELRKVCIAAGATLALETNIDGAAFMFIEWERENS